VKDCQNCPFEAEEILNNSITSGKINEIVCPLDIVLTEYKAPGTAGQINSWAINTFPLLRKRHSQIVKN
jgi:hypothetical protein